MLIGLTLFCVNICAVGSTTSTRATTTTIEPVTKSLCSTNNTCLNGGTCREPEDWECSTDPGMGDTVCDCQAGFNGARCEIKVTGVCGGVFCERDQRCVLRDSVGQVFQCVSDSDTRDSTAPHCSRGPHPLNYTLDLGDREKSAVCLDMYYTTTASYCYDNDSSIDFEIVHEDIKDLFCLTIDYHTWQTCLGVNKTFHRDNFPKTPVMDVIIVARENDRDARSASITFRVTFNTAPSVTRSRNNYILNMALLGNPHTIDIEQDFGVTDPERVIYTLEGSSSQLSIDPNTGALSVFLQDKDMISDVIKIQDDGIPSLSTTIQVNIEVLTLDCSQTRKIFYVNYKDVGGNTPSGKMQCQYSKRYKPKYVIRSQSGLELNIDESTSLLVVTRGSVGDFPVQVDISIAGKLTFLVTFTTVIREMMTCVFNMSTEQWKPAYTNSTSQDFQTLERKTQTAIMQSVGAVQNVTVEILLFREGSVFAYFLLMALTKASLENANRNLRSAVEKGVVGTLPVNQTSYRSFTQVGLVQIDQLVYSSSDVSNTPLATLNNTRVEMTCEGFFLLPVGVVTIEWRVTNKNGLVVPLPFSRLQTRTTIPSSGVYVGTLTANNILVKDTGPVTCTLTDDIGRSTSKTQDIRVIAPPIVTLTPLGQALIRSTETLVLTCDVTEPRNIPTTIKWFRNTQLYRTDSLKQTSDLTVDGSNPQSFSYHCQGENGAGTGRDSNTITVYITQVETKRCEAEERWPPSTAGIIVEAPCPPGETGTQTRLCGADGTWQAVNRSQCVSNDIGDVIEDIQWLADGVQVSSLSTVTETLAEKTTPKTLQTREVELIAESLDVLLNISRENNITDDKEATVDFTKGFVSTASNILDPETADEWTNIGARPTIVLTQIDSVTEVSAESLSEGEIERIKSTNIDLQVGKTDPKNLENIVFPTMSQREEDVTLASFLVLNSDAVNRTSGNRPLSYSTIYYKNITAQLPTGLQSNRSDNTTLKINSDTLALNIFSEKALKLMPPLKLNFSHTNKSVIDNDRTRVCSYLNTDTNQWETDGCNATETQRYYTVCECDHLTNFAILMNPYSQAGIYDVLSIITIIGCSISILCLVVTIIIYIMVWRYVKSGQAVILMNICVVLCIAMLLFVVGVDKTENQTGCTVIAISLHFFYLVTFFLMLGAGLEIVWTIMQVFSTRSKHKLLLVGAWLLPLLVVGVSMAGTQLRGYGTENFCWLSIEGGLIWAFVGPVLLIVVINFVIIGILVHKILTTKAMQDQDLHVKIKKGLRGMCVLLPILGVSWVFGILAVNEQLVVFQYVFAILNSLQGLFILISQCCLSKKVRKGLASYKRRYQSQRSHLSSRQRDQAASPGEAGFGMLVRDKDSSAYQNLLQSSTEDPSFVGISNPAERRLPDVQTDKSVRPSGYYADIPEGTPQRISPQGYSPGPIQRTGDPTYEGLDRTNRMSNKYEDFSTAGSIPRGGRLDDTGLADVHVSQRDAQDRKRKEEKKRKETERGVRYGYENTQDTGQSPQLEEIPLSRINSSTYANMPQSDLDRDRGRLQPIGKEDVNPYESCDVEPYDSQDFIPYAPRHDSGNRASGQSAFQHMASQQ